MAYNNSSNINVTGVVTASGTGTYSGSALTQYGVLIGSSNNNMLSTAVGNATNFLTSGGAGVNPSYTDVYSTFIAGPVSSTTNALMRYSGTSGNLAKDSLLIVGSTGNMTNSGASCFSALAAAQSLV